MISIEREGEEVQGEEGEDGEVEKEDQEEEEEEEEEEDRGSSSIPAFDPRRFSLTEEEGQEVGREAGEGGGVWAAGALTSDVVLSLATSPPRGLETLLGTSLAS